ncbi:hypothetical protein B7463_g7742, partial [Scytalidium lignicola]
MENLFSKPVILTRSDILKYGIPTTVFLTFNLIAFIVYRIFYHPLARYPGPLISKITGLYHTYHALTSDQAHNFYHLHAKYGPIVRYTPNGVSICSVEGIKAIYGNSRSTKKAESYLAFPRDPKKASLFSVIDKDVHARKRRIFRHGFTDASLQMAERTIDKHIASLAECLMSEEPDKENLAQKCTPDRKEGWSRPRNMATWINRFTFDVSSELSFGKSFGVLKNKTNRFIIEITHSTLQADNVTASAITLLHKLGLKKLVFRRARQLNSIFDSFIRDATSERVEAGISENRKDFFHWLMDAQDPETGERFEFEELCEEATLLITAGSDTSSTAICSTLYYLAHNPEKLETLIKEIRSAFPTLESVRSGITLQNCSYLRACMDEGLRLSPPAGSVLHREVLPGGLSINDNFFPEGTDVGVPAYALHHDAAYFERPFSFEPERWIVGSQLSQDEKSGEKPSIVTPDSVRLAASAFAPFSAGSRGCVGKPLAYLQISLLFARLLWEYDMRLYAGAWINGKRSGDGKEPLKEYALVDLFISWKNGPLLEFRRRSVESSGMVVSPQTSKDVSRVIAVVP